ncbi:MAG: ShlB/FhaC/HecB family hemolysin secretion/activation protein [Erythrobacter sp.]|nr:ShlB/FhaC/HecB family hemolysin secretion/activation protein [Erythrobacter sp.]
MERQFSLNGLIGQAVPLDRIVSLVQLINRALVANGYINSGVLIDGPPPEPGGILKLQLVFGQVVDAEGQPGADISFGGRGRNRLTERFVEQRLPAIARVPLNAIALEREFRLLAANPAIDTVSADLQPGERPGEARLSLLIDPAPLFDFYTSFANSRAPSIGGERIGFGGFLRNLLRPGDVISAETGFTSGRQDLIAGYEAPLIGPRSLFHVRGGFNNAAVVDPELLDLDITAQDWQIEGGLGVRVVDRPLTPQGTGRGWRTARELILGASVFHRQSDTTLLGRPFSFTPGAVNGRAEYTALRLTGDFADRGVNRVFAVALTLTQGLDGTLSDIPGLISPDRDFRAARLQVSYARRLSENGLELRSRLVGQYADGILYSGERFAAGGAQSVRGYRETLVLADTGLNGSVELVRAFSLSGRGEGRLAFDPGRFSASVFADGAILGNREGPAPAAGELASVGATLAWAPAPWLEAMAAYGEALIDAPITGSRDLQDRGVSFRITVRPLALLRR